MYDFVTGPLAWLSFLIFFIGVCARIVWYIKGLDWQLDRVAYTQNVSFGVKGAIRSVIYWLFPYGTYGWRQNWGLTALVFMFHFGLLTVPVFLNAHQVLLSERFGFRYISMPDGLADGLTLAVIICAVFLALRRIVLAEVRILTTAYDYLLLVIAAAPFVTGYIAAHTTSGAEGWTIAHVLAGEVMLISIPITKLSHFVLFFMSRAQLGMDFGTKRGGMKGQGMAW